MDKPYMAVLLAVVTLWLSKSELGTSLWRSRRRECPHFLQRHRAAPQTRLSIPYGRVSRLDLLFLDLLISQMVLTRTYSMSPLGRCDSTHPDISDHLCTYLKITCAA